LQAQAEEVVGAAGREEQREAGLRARAASLEQNAQVMGAASLEHALRGECAFALALVKPLNPQP